MTQFNADTIERSLQSNGFFQNLQLWHIVILTRMGFQPLALIF